MKWTVMDQKGNKITEGVIDIDEWLKGKDVYVVARLNAAKTLIIYT